MTSPADDAVAIDVLHRDEHFLAASKPGGLLVHRSRESSDRRFLLQLLREQTGAFLYPVHRLDRAASGVIVFALSSEVAAALQERLGDPATRKEYLVVVRGSAPESGRTERPLSDDRGIAREADTEWVRLAELSGLSLLRVRTRTGRRHQIRRHFAHLRHQLLGDTTYGKGRINRWFREQYGLPRLCLHAWELELAHPVTGERLVLRAPLASDLRGFLLGLPDAPRALIETL